MKIIVGVDGSVFSQRAVEWCADFATLLDAEVVAVHAIEFPVYSGAFGYAATPYTEPQRADMQEVVEEKWCEPLARAHVPFKAVLADGSPAIALMDIAHSEQADLVVTGRRGLGGFAELLLGSTSHHLSHHLDRPLVIIP